MWKSYKKHIILSSLFTLLPVLIGLLYWNQLPDLIPTHWGPDGQADSYSGKAFTVFFIPLVLLAVHWLCLFITAHDPKNKGRNRKGLLLVMWLMPLISNFVVTMIYASALDLQLSPAAMVTVPIGLLFLVIGNYMPKIQQNHTLGIKIKWTLANEENWNLTHRFAGKCWALGGLLMLLCCFLPETAVIWGIFASCIFLVLIPLFYSYGIYRRHKQQGIEYTWCSVYGSRKARRFSVLFTVLTLVFVCWIMFTGDITCSAGEEALTIEADFFTDLTVSYDSMDSVEFREGNIPGTRVGGFASARLLMGNFRNEEFGSYTRYTYTNPDGCILIRSGSRILVVSTRHYSETLKLYLRLMDAVSRS